MTIAEALQNKFIANTYPNRGLAFVQGEDVYLITEEGSKYLDFGSNFGVNLLGYDIFEIKNKIKAQVDLLMNCHGSFASDPRSQASKKLVSMMSDFGFGNLSKVLWANYGAEAVDAALKIALMATGRGKIIAPQNDYHGKTIGALSATTSNHSKYQKPFAKFLLPTDYFEYGNYESLEKIISTEHAALIIEPIQAEGGVIVPPEEFFPKVSELCKKYGVLLIVDEIQTGLGRNGRFLNIEKYIDGNFHCDLLLLGKGLGGGLPVSSVLISEELNSKINKGVHTSTTGGNPLSMAGVLAFLEYIKQHKIIQNSQKVSQYWFNEMNHLKLRFPELIFDVRGQGMMMGVEIKMPPMEILKELQKQQIIALPCNVNSIRFLPPLIIQTGHVDQLIKTLETIFRAKYV